MSFAGGENAASSSVKAAVLQPSDEMPKGSQNVEELDFNAYNGRSITVEELIDGIKYMGFRASSIGEAVRIISEAVCRKTHWASAGCLSVGNGLTTGCKTSESMARS
jgi:deoxyhypusine synthase